MMSIVEGTKNLNFKARAAIISDLGSRKVRAVVVVFFTPSKLSPLILPFSFSPDLHQDNVKLLAGKCLPLSHCLSTPGPHSFPDIVLIYKELCVGHPFSREVSSLKEI